MRLLPLAATLIAATALQAAAQGTTVPFGRSHDATQPVEITSDALQLDQAGGTALFTGTVKVGQGELRLAADRLKVFYVAGTAGAQGTVERMEAEGNVTLANGSEAASGDRAVYEVATGLVDMSGDVLLTQGPNALSSQTLHIDLNGGTAQLEGRVRTIFTPGSTSPGNGR
ncbi:LptA/OstA family protein [Amaricoccus solimangrovi]|uniref:Lipopolysaccharide transport periplasmic protein LptA n=1 Tax=Amaricoccus solimangrovi TaxID=2589815 RepID=A0A501WS61_9RHOB|nr:LptA/OstA family protein [Amaricoccus solimangrovi]TPE52573.1 lipopolysaccharide transport periplasmic protein LptA [Amaricoccus solimangrovi]